MNVGHVIELAKEAGFPNAAWAPEPFAKFAALVAAKEREACAALAQATVCDTHIPTGVKIYGTRAAAAIRARDKP